MSNERPTLAIPPAAEWKPGFDAAQATDAWIATVPAAARAKSDAYFEGGYWMEFGGTLIALAAAWLLLASRASSRWRDFCETKFRRAFPATLLFGAGFVLAWAVLLLPWDFYTGYVREHRFGMSNQDLAGFLGDWAKGLGVNLVVLSLAIAGLYAVMRRVGRRWVPWATAAAAAFMALMMVVAPIFIKPLFNDYKPMAEGPLRDRILALAARNDIPAKDVYWFDASRQTKRVSANVSGLFGTTRISLNDNLLNGASEPEILAVMAHEMGHYVLGHSLKLVLGFTLVIGFGFWAVGRGFGAVQRRHGAKWGLRGISDPAGLPLVVAILVGVFYLLTPVTNTIVRTAEHEADAFGLDAAREPQGFAGAAMRISDYRKIAPSRLEEMVFFDHPSGRSRVERSMRWLAAHPPGTR
ncbi:MAG: M48 family metallopeptidase [Vicinamibacterales bacterium]